MANKKAAANSAAEITENGNLMNVPFHLLKEVEGFNVREDMGDINLLARQIRVQGLKNPLRGLEETDEATGKTVRVIDGHRRMAALALIASEGVNKGDLIDLNAIPVLRDDKGDDPKNLIITMFLSNEGKPLTVLEQAEVVRRLMAEPFKMKGNQVAAELGMTPANITKLGRLLRAPEPLREAVKNGTLSATKVMDIVQKNKTEEAIAVLNEGGDVENLEMEADNSKSTGSSKKKEVAEATKEQNSFREFKKASPMIDDKLIEDDGRKATFKFMVKVMNNQYSYDQILRYFKMKKVDDGE